MTNSNGKPNHPRDNNQGKGAQKRKSLKRAQLETDSLEPRILLSATWIDPDTGAVMEDASDEPVQVFGDDLAETLNGLGGDDSLFGLGGDDTLFGDSGDDTLDGGEGADVLIGGEGSDTASYANSNEGVNVLLKNTDVHGPFARQNSGGHGGEAEGDSYDSIENVVGSAHNDYVFGSQSGGTIDLGDGDDVFDNDYNQNVSDTILGGEGNDTAWTGDGQDHLDGGAGNDQLYGESGDDVLIGGEGDDIINGGSNTEYMVSLNENGASGQYLVVEEFHGFPSHEITFETNFQLTGDNNAPLISYSADGHHNEFLVNTFEDGTIHIGVANTHVALQSPVDLYDGESHELAVTWESTTGQAKLYIDGNFAGEVVVSQGASIADGGTLIFGQEQDSQGGSFDAGNAFEGRLNDVRIFNNIRSAEQIASDAKGIVTETATSQLVSRYPFNEGGDVAEDFAGHNDLTLAGGALRVIESTADFDTVVYSGKASDYEITANANRTFTVRDMHGTDGTDLVSNIERFQFADGNFVVLNGELIPGDFIASPTYDEIHIEEGDRVVLSADVSVGSTATVAWHQVSGPSVALDNAQGAAPSFVAPQDIQSYEVAFEVTISDGNGVRTEIVTIAVHADNDRPEVAAMNIEGATKIAGSFSAAEVTSLTLSVDVADVDTASDQLTYKWTQVSGEHVSLDNPNAAAPKFMSPNTTESGELVFRVEVSDGESTSVQEVKVLIEADNDDLVHEGAGVLLDASTWRGGNDDIQFTTRSSAVSDTMIRVDPSKTYELTGFAMSGDENGENYDANNRQYFGVANYDIDKNFIAPVNVLKFGNAMDTSLAQPLKPGDTQIVLNDASGWNNAGAGHQRTLAWYGYTDSTGHTYDDYTYTRNVSRYDLWDEGAIEGNVITLREPWTGPTIEAGEAVRNTQSGGTYQYTGLSYGKVPNEWTEFDATMGEEGTAFRAGTAYVKPLILSNYHAATYGDDSPNLVTWKDVSFVEVNPVIEEGTAVSLTSGIIDPEGQELTYNWRQIGGPSVSLDNTSAEHPSFTTPSDVNGEEVLRFEVEVSDGEHTTIEVIEITVSDNESPLVTLKEPLTVTEGESFRMPIEIRDLDNDNLTVQWVQTGGPHAALDNPSVRTPMVTAPEHNENTTLTFEVTVSDGEYTKTETVTIELEADNDAPIKDVAGVLLDASTWRGGNDDIQFTTRSSAVSDTMIRVDPNKTYELTGFAMSGDENGENYDANNRQYFGVANYDIDKNFIAPVNVLKFGNAMDTSLAQPLKPGDTQIVLNDASGWNNAGAGHQRTLAWYGYTDSTGHTYDDYTYTRNVSRYDLWDEGAIEGNVITLREPWTGPTIEAGEAVRNTQSGGTYQYTGLSYGKVPNEWTEFDATMGEEGTAFRAGTAYVKPLILSNYHATTYGDDSPNLVTWKDVSFVEVNPVIEEGTEVTLTSGVRDPEGQELTFSWKQTSGPTVELSAANGATPSFRAPSLVTSAVLTFEVEVSDGVNVTTETVSLTVDADNDVQIGGDGDNDLTADNDNDILIGDHWADNALRLNGIGDAMVIDTTEMNLVDAFTVSATVKLEAHDGWDVIFEKVGPDGRNDFMMGFIEGKLVVEFMDDDIWEGGVDPQKFVIADAADFLGDYHNFAYTYAEGNISVYVDGELVRTIENVGEFTNHPGIALIGADTDRYPHPNSDPFEGEIADVQIYSKALSRDEVRLALTGKTVNEGLVAHYDFEGESPLSDKSGNGFDGTAAGSPTIVDHSGTAGNDTLDGKQGDDILVGGQGDDVLIGGEGNDLLIGGAGFDQAIFRGPLSAYTVSANEDGSLTVIHKATGDTDTVYDVEQLRFDNFDIDTMTGLGFNFTPQISVEEGATFNLTVSAASTLGNSITYQWRQVSGHHVSLSDPNSSNPSVTAPNLIADGELIFEIKISDGEHERTELVTVHVGADNDALVSSGAGALLNVSTWRGGNDDIQFTTRSSAVSDTMIRVDPSKTYELTGFAMSGDENGENYDANNRQYFGVANYDIDKNFIHPFSVLKYSGAADTELAQALKPGDTEIHLKDASGWSTSSAWYSRTLAWYNYSDSTGNTYDDYTYTRNYSYGGTYGEGLWEPGSVDFVNNVIKLNKPWSGPEIQAGDAVRNSTSGGTYQYTALSYGKVPNEFTEFDATMGKDGTAFRAGTAYIKPLILSNYHDATYGAGSNNLVTWRDVSFVERDPDFNEGDTITLNSGVSDPDGQALTYNWRQVSGPAVELSDNAASRPAFVAPNTVGSYDLTFEVEVSDGEHSLTETVTIHIEADNDGPVAASDGGYSTNEDEPISFLPQELLRNDVDVEGAALSIMSVQDAQHGTVELNPDGTIIFTPDANYSGRASFAYTISDGDGGTSIATVEIDVQSVLDGSTLTSQDAAGVEDTAIELNVAATLADVDGSEWVQVKIAGIPMGASLSAGIDNGDGSYTLTTEQLQGLRLEPPANFSGDIGLTVSATTQDVNGQATTTWNTLNVSVASVRDDLIVDNVNIGGRLNAGGQYQGGITPSSEQGVITGRGGVLDLAGLANQANQAQAAAQQSDADKSGFGSLSKDEVDELSMSFSIQRNTVLENQLESLTALVEQEAQANSDRSALSAQPLEVDSSNNLTEYQSPVLGSVSRYETDPASYDLVGRVSGQLESSTAATMNATDAQSDDPYANENGKASTLIDAVWNRVGAIWSLLSGFAKDERNR